MRKLGWRRAFLGHNAVAAQLGRRRAEERNPADDRSWPADCAAKGGPLAAVLVLTPEETDIILHGELKGLSAMKRGLAG